MVKASLVAMAVMDKEIFQIAEQYPWRLLQGDVQSNLEALKDAPEVSEATAWKIQKLMQEGHNMHELLEWDANPG